MRRRAPLDTATEATRAPSPAMFLADGSALAALLAAPIFALDLTFLWPIPLASVAVHSILARRWVRRTDESRRTHRAQVQRWIEAGLWDPKLLPRFGYGDFAPCGIGVPAYLAEWAFVFVVFALVTGFVTLVAGPFADRWAAALRLGVLAGSGAVVLLLAALGWAALSKPSPGDDQRQSLLEALRQRLPADRCPPMTEHSPSYLVLLGSYRDVPYGIEIFGDSVRSLYLHIRGAPGGEVREALQGANPQAPVQLLSAEALQQRLTGSLPGGPTPAFPPRAEFDGTYVRVAADVTAVSDPDVIVRLLHELIDGAHTRHLHT